MYNTSFYHISFVRPFIIFKETPTSSVLPFRFAASQPTTSAATNRCEVVVTCQMIVTSHGGGRMSCRFFQQICCWTMVFMYSNLHDLNMMVIILQVDFWCGSVVVSATCKVILHFVLLIAGFCMILLHSQQKVYEGRIWWKHALECWKGRIFLHHLDWTKIISFWICSSISQDTTPSFPSIFDLFWPFFGHNPCIPSPMSKVKSFTTARSTGEELGRGHTVDDDSNWMFT